MKKPEKFEKFINALEIEPIIWSAHDRGLFGILEDVYGINKEELNDCLDFLDYITSLEKYFEDVEEEEKTCYIKYITDEEQYYGAVCSACNFELSKYMDDYGNIDLEYCPNCGASII